MINKQNKTKQISLTGVVAALYIVVTLLNPIGWGVIQLRFSEILCMLPFYDRRYTPGIILGVAVANLFSPLGPIDAAFGVSVAVISYTLGRYIKSKYLNAFQYSITAGILIGIELFLVLGLPFLFNFVSTTISTGLMSIMGVLFLNKNYERITKIAK